MTEASFRVHFLEDPSEDLSAGSADGHGKFLQLFHREEGEFLVFATQSFCTYHAQIAQRFCCLREPPWYFEINRKGDMGNLCEDGASILGGGFWELEPKLRILALGGRSEAFGPFVQDGLIKKLSTLPRFSGYTVYC